jgi:hypothetical protein
MPLRRAGWVAVIAIAIFVVIFATSLGVGVSPDSTAYIGTARRWLQRLHFSGIAGPISRSSDFGPLYPISLTLGSLVSRVDPRVVARWLNVIAFPANLMLAGMLVRRATPAAASSSVVVGLVALASIPILVLHTMAWSEPLFLLYLLVNVATVDRYLRQPTRGRLIVMAVAAAACILQRFAGAACVAMTAVAVLVWAPVRRAERVAAAVFVSAVAGVPYIAWRLVSSDYRSFGVHPPSMSTLRSTVDVASRWIVPDFFDLALIPRTIAAALVVLITAVVVRRWRRSVGGDAPNPPSYVLRLLGVFTCCYVLVVVLSLSFWDSQLLIDDRILAPLQLCSIIAAVVALSRARWGGAIVIALGIAWLSLKTFDAATWVARTHREGQWYASSAWQQSPTMQFVLGLPPDAIVVTNGDDAVGAVIDRRARRLPDRVNPATGAPNPDYELVMADLHERLRAGNSVIVLFDRLRDRAYIPDEQELSKLWRLSKVAVFPDGVVYRLRND